MNEITDFPMIGESTRTTPSHHSKSSREGLEKQDKNVVILSEIQERHDQDSNVDVI